MLIIIFYIIIFIISIYILLELFFKILYKLTNKRNYKIIDTNIIDNFFYDKHPYLTYTYKKKFFIPKQNLRSNIKNLHLFGIKTNSLGFTNGVLGDKEIITPKPSNTLRISCLGASTTAHYLSDNKKILSYPIALEENLITKLKNYKNIEVNNYGMGGWNSADILINFILNVYDSKPDIVVIYHAFNDLGISLTDNFKSDYNHSKLNFSYYYSRFEILKKFINFKSSIYNYLITKWLNLRKTNDIYDLTETLKPNIENEFKGLDTYKRNIEMIIKICEQSNIEVILSSFAYQRDLNDLDNNLDIKYYRGLEQENKTIFQLAEKYKLNFVDNFKFIPKNKLYFTDDIHFSHYGMREIAKNFSNSITNLLLSKK